MKSISKKQTDLKTSTIAEKRCYLKELSKGFGTLKKQGQINTINEALKSIYSEQGHSVLKTYEQWKKEGKHVKKGEKALLLWGRPKGVQRLEDENSQDETFFPICFVFSNLQVSNS